jgi:thiosulfate/3-mercaptopyruvate sulfurtransferase
MNPHSTLVSCSWLYQHLDDPNLVIADCRFTLGKPEQGSLDYRSGHIPHALHFDLEKDLSGPKQKHGGRHPLPSVDSLVYLFSNAGIDENVLVVAYDEQEMAGAARLWWLLRYLGHEKVAVLDGGLKAWKVAGLPLTTEIIDRPSRRFVPKLQSHMLTEIEDIQKRDASTTLIDSRAGERYRGEVETLDPKAGHIPGALHYFYQENLKADGTMKSATVLKERFEALPERFDIVVYCGSGVTACVNILALHQIGRSDAKLYAGSWSDWCSYDLPIQKGALP